MKTITYKILTHIPIVGSVVRGVVDPIALFGSNELADGYCDDLFKKLEEYHKEHPDIQITRQLIDKIMTNK
jgi:hypothetical protein